MEKRGKGPKKKKEKKIMHLYTYQLTCFWTPDGQLNFTSIRSIKQGNETILCVIDFILCCGRKRTLRCNIVNQ